MNTVLNGYFFFLHESNLKVLISIVLVADPMSIRNMLLYYRKIKSIV